MVSAAALLVLAFLGLALALILTRESLSSHHNQNSRLMDRFKKKTQRESHIRRDGSRAKDQTDVFSRDGARQETKAIQVYIRPTGRAVLMAGVPFSPV